MRLITDTIDEQGNPNGDLIAQMVNENRKAMGLEPQTLNTPKTLTDSEKYIAETYYLLGRNDAHLGLDKREIEPIKCDCGTVSNFAQYCRNCGKQLFEF